jgi:hypothetical protein
MKIKFIFYSLILLLFSACSADNASKKISFYHWKSNAIFPDSYDKVLTETKTEKIYLHYFDIDKVETERWGDDGIYPRYVIKNIAQEFKAFEIIPVVYITNRVFQTADLDIDRLSDKIVQLINQISTKHFGKILHSIQIDCDWTQSTRASYFSLLESLKKQFEIDVTIRLHQIKFQEATGIPPVESGTLMLYNVGDLRNKEQNSILENEIVKQYLNTVSSYPLPLNLALPLFSQSIVINKENEIKIIKNSVRTCLEGDQHFRKINDTNFQVVKDTLFKGFYLSEGYRLKLEEANELELMNAYNTVKNSQLMINEIIFYHLDEPSLLSIDVKKIVKEL